MTVHPRSPPEHALQSGAERDRATVITAAAVSGGAGGGSGTDEEG
ncbi:hypothetical protein [Nocardia speluncae]|nr:hypothetical protein [Nocardia speluncae]